MGLTFKWTAERVDALRGMMNAGMSATQCADALSLRYGEAVSRSAVIGKADRAGLKWLGAAGKPSYVARESKPPRREPPPAVSPLPWEPKPKPQAPKPAAVLARGGWPKPANPESVNFWSLKPDHCRMPLWCDAAPPPFDEQMYCGRQVERPGASWCASCARLVAGSGTYGEAKAADVRDAERVMRRAERVLA